MLGDLTDEESNDLELCIQGKGRNNQLFALPMTRDTVELGGLSAEQTSALPGFIQQLATHEDIPVWQLLLACDENPHSQPCTWKLCLQVARMCESILRKPGKIVHDVLEANVPIWSGQKRSRRLDPELLTELGETSPEELTD